MFYIRNKVSGVVYEDEPYETEEEAEYARDELAMCYGNNYEVIKK